MIPLHHILIFSATLFCTGFYGALTRRHAVGILIAIELMLNAVNINLVSFSRFIDKNPESGQIFAIFVIVMAAASAAVGLAVVLSIYRNQNTIYTDEIDLLKW